VAAAVGTMLADQAAAVLVLSAGLLCGLACLACLAGYGVAPRGWLRALPEPWPHGGAEWGERFFGAIVGAAPAISGPLAGAL
jgi:hypothetical protein